jgi:hypothetical protein
LLPSFNWEVKSGSKSDWEGLGVPPECIYLNETLTAAQVLDRYVHTLDGAHVLGPMSVAAGYRQQFDNLLSQMIANHARDHDKDFTTTGDTAALRLETINGSFTIEQRLRARVICTLQTKPGANPVGNCSARVDVLRAPKGQLDALTSFVASQSLTNAKHDDSWLNAVLARMGKVPFDPPHPGRTALAMVHRQAEDFGLTAERRHEAGHELGHEFEEIRDFKQSPHERVMEMLGQAEVKPDWADSALDSLTQIRSGSAVQPITVHTWSSTAGQQYQTCNPNANPNGVLDGSWTETPQVHRNDQPQ